MFRAIPILLVCLVAGSGVVAGRPQSDLDQFMNKVLARRDENWKKLQQYVLDEHDQVDIHGPSKTPIWGDRRDYTWFIREGFFVQSPVTVNGVTVSESERRKYEDTFLKQARAREARGRRGGAPPDRNASPADPSDVGGLLSQSRQPGFMDSAYFLRFKFEEGKYALVGHESFEGRDVLRVEYYPDRLFSREQDAQTRRDAQGVSNRKKDVDATMERLMNKVALVTLWIEPADFQIVKYTFDNVSMDFLPVAWLLRADDLKATMTMGQPFPGVWLPRDVAIDFGATVASGSFDVAYRVSYQDYREAATSGRIVSFSAP